MITAVAKLDEHPDAVLNDERLDRHLATRQKFRWRGVESNRHAGLPLKAVNASFCLFCPAGWFSGFPVVICSMCPLLHLVWEKAMNLARNILLVSWSGAVMLHGADSPQEASPQEIDPAIPQSVKAESFDAILAHSPFTRSLGVSDSLILTGIANIENNVFATLFDTQTMESHVVSKTANPQGWQLVGVGGSAAELQTLTAKIQVAGGQLISVRYGKPPPKTARSILRGGSSSGGNAAPLSQAQMDEARQAAVNYREGFNADGYPKAPPTATVEKLSRLSVSQREDINRQMFGLRNQGLGMEERRKIYEDTVNRATQGR